MLAPNTTVRSASASPCACIEQDEPTILRSSADGSCLLTLLTARFLTAAFLSLFCLTLICLLLLCLAFPAGLASLVIGILHPALPLQLRQMMGIVITLQVDGRKFRMVQNLVKFSTGIGSFFVRLGKFSGIDRDRVQILPEKQATAFLQLRPWPKYRTRRSCEQAHRDAHGCAEHDCAKRQRIAMRMLALNTIVRSASASRCARLP